MRTSHIGRAARGVLTAFAKNQRTNNRKTDVLIQRREELLRRHGDKGRLVVVKFFVRAAVQRFANGDVAAAKRFYGGAFCFIHSHRLIRGRLLGASLAAARTAYTEGDHEVVWRLLAAARTFCPRTMQPSDVDELFRRWGIEFESLEPPRDLEPLQKLQSVRHLLPAAVAA